MHHKRVKMAPFREREGEFLSHVPCTGALHEYSRTCLSLYLEETSGIWTGLNYIETLVPISHPVSKGYASIHH